jgi:hypothetical protein
VADPRLQLFPRPIQKAVEKDAASFDVYLSSLVVKPWRVPPSAEHGGEAAIELQYKVQVDILKPDSSIVAFAIERAVSERYPDHVSEFGSRLCQEAIRAPEWSVNSSKPLRELAFRRFYLVLLSQALRNLRIAQTTSSQFFCSTVEFDSKGKRAGSPPSGVTGSSSNT